MSGNNNFTETFFTKSTEQNVLTKTGEDFIIGEDSNDSLVVGFVLFIDRYVYGNAINDVDDRSSCFSHCNGAECSRIF